MNTQRPASPLLLDQLYLTLRDDLSFTLHREGEQLHYVVEDRARSKFFRLGVQEYSLLSQLDGKTSLAAVHQQVQAAESASDSLTEEQAASIARWAIEAGLMKQSAQSRDSSAGSGKRRPLLQLHQLLVTRLPLFAPDQFFARITPTFKWLFSKMAFAVWCLLMLIAGNCLLQNWTQFRADSEGVFFLSNWGWMALCWLALKIVHELAHGVVCKKFGGDIREAGCMLILLMPLAYIDVTSSWRFRSKWQRILTATAGIYVELAVAAVAILFWAQCDPGPLRATCVNVVVMASVTTILFNANPLMRFDGYYVLSDLLQIPNLYANARRYMLALGGRVFLGIKSTTNLPEHKGRAWFVRCYAFLSLVWRCAISMTLILVAATMFHGAGIVLAAIGVVAWYGTPFLRLVRFLVGSSHISNSARLRMVGSVAVVVAAIAAVYLWVPTPLAATTPGVVQFDPLTEIRPACDGFVRELYVSTGDFVEAGAPIARLENEDLERELRELEIDERLAELKCRGHKRRDETAAYQAGIKELESIRQRLETRRAQVADLSILAPRAGYVVTRNVDALEDTYIEAGGVLLALGDDTRKEIRISISQSDLPSFTEQVAKEVSLRTSGGRGLNAHLIAIEPRATKTPWDLSLCASHGGDLPVRVVAPDEDNRVASQQRYQYFAPRFVGILELSDVTSQQLAAGQRVTVSVTRSDDTLGASVLDAASRWIKRRVSGDVATDS